MVRRIAVSIAAFLASQALFTLSARAASFPDVPRDHPFGASIALLADMKIVTGNPDGNFYPAKPVNRAEFLTMLYRAKGWTPSAPSASCFGDVAHGSWYEAVVCDAAAKGYVAGYPDGKFRPEKEVNRVESLKMIFKVFGYDATNDFTLDIFMNANSFVDIDWAAWYVPYFKAAYLYEILPVAGQGMTYYYPNSSLLRGEAAAYIHHSLDAKASPNIIRGNNAASSSSSVVTRSSRSSESSSVSDVTIHDFDFPFNDDGTFTRKQKELYRFSLRESASVELKASVDANASPSGLSCTLFKLNETGLSFEYYFGFENGNECVVSAALTAGDYQFEIGPRMSGATFSVHATTRKSFGNDGFSEAKALVKNQPKVAFLEVGDTSDWYKFSLSQETTMTINLSEGDAKCLIYPMENVSLASFSGPVCNAEYAYPRGTYYVGVIRKNFKPEKTSYTIGY